MGAVTVAFVFETDTMTQADYDGLMAEMGLAEVGTAIAAGAVAHIAGPKPDGGWRVVDVWESEDAANAFYGSERFAPVRAEAERAGIRTSPWPVHRIELSAT